MSSVPNAPRIERCLDCYLRFRGGFPEHTLTGFKNSVKHGVSVMEVDLNYTSDGHLVVFHDYTVDRTSNGTGLLSHMTLAEAKALDVGVKYW